MKKLLALVLCLALVAALFVGCSENKTETGKPADAGKQTEAGKETSGTTIKVGLICIGDENDQGYTYNFIRGKDAATEALKAKGINVEWVVKWNVPEGDACEDANRELAAAGCKVIFNNSFGFEDFMLKVAPDYPDIQFVSCTNQGSWNDSLKNTHNAFANHPVSTRGLGCWLGGFCRRRRLQQIVSCTGLQIPNRGERDGRRCFDCHLSSLQLRDITCSVGNISR